LNLSLELFEINICYIDEGVFTLHEKIGNEKDRIQSHVRVLNLSAMFVRGYYGTFQYNNMKVSVRMTHLKNTAAAPGALAEELPSAKPNDKF